LFTKELDVALLDGSVDICVHSLKDVPTYLPDKTTLPCTLEREDSRDAFIVGSTSSYKTLDDLPEGSIIGTASLRRQAQIMAKHPTFKCVNFRGNVQTRLKKLDAGVVDATLLAIAGLNRMDMQSVAASTFEFSEMLPAVAQGAIGLQCRTDDLKSLKYIEALNHVPTKICVDCERSFLAALEGNCRTPIAGQAQIIEGELHFRGLVAMPDGSGRHEVTMKSSLEGGIEMGRLAGEEIKKLCGDGFYERMMKMSKEMTPQ
jgi:hydroxymethylbilane synthase